MWKGFIVAVVCLMTLFLCVSAHASLSGPTSNGSGNVTFTSNSIDAVFTSPLSSGSLLWTNTEDTTVGVSFDYLITANNLYNNASVGGDWGVPISFFYTDGQTHHFTDLIQLAAGEGFYLTANASHSGEVYLSNIAVSTVPIPAAVWLLGSGLLGLVAVRRKRAK